MTLWNEQDLAKALDCKDVSSFKANSVSIDSRTVQKGDIFIAIKGESTDGHLYLAKAFEAGASVAIVSYMPNDVKDDWPIVLVDNTMKALEDLAKYNRQRSKAKFIAVTGSVGKTTAKEMLGFVFAKQGKTFMSYGNFNNHIGVPLNMSRMEPDCDYVVLELGMNHAGEISHLTKMVQPDVAIITTVEAVHLEFFNSVEEIALAKAEIIEGLKDGGAIILNKDNKYFSLIAGLVGKKQKIISFGKDGDIRLVANEIKDFKADVVASYNNEEISYALSVYGLHNVMNSLSVLAGVDALGGDFKKAAKDIAGYVPYNGRGVIEKVKLADKNIIFIDESYNASPASVKALLLSLGQIKQGSSVKVMIVLADMFELGESAKELHQGLLPEILTNNIDIVFAAGDLMGYLYKDLPDDKKGGYAKQPLDLKQFVLDEVEESCIIAFKGSRGMAVEKLIKSLKEQ